MREVSANIFMKKTQDISFLVKAKDHYFSCFDFSVKFQDEKDLENSKELKRFTKEQMYSSKYFKDAYKIALKLFKITGDNEYYSNAISLGTYPISRMTSDNNMQDELLIVNDLLSSYNLTRKYLSMPDVNWFEKMIYPVIANFYLNVSLDFYKDLPVSKNRLSFVHFSKAYINEVAFYLFDADEATPENLEKGNYTSKEDYLDVWYNSATEASKLARRNSQIRRLSLESALRASSLKFADANDDFSKLSSLYSIKKMLADHYSCKNDKKNASRMLYGCANIREMQFNLTNQERFMKYAKTHYAEAEKLANDK